MSWFREVKLSFLQGFCCKVLKTGSIPKHIALIMDGNRRFAQKNGLETIEGHTKGFEKLAETLQWCLELGITEVSVYAFSLENFKRTNEEVEGLMVLLREKCERLLHERDKIMENGVCVRFLGDLTRLPKTIQRFIAKIMLLSRDNKKAFLNVYVAYTSRDEIVKASNDVVEGVELGFIEPSDISEYVFSKCMYSSQSPDPDMLLRTSGEVRLSDFLLWQCSYSVLAFVEVLWPDFTIWKLFMAILYYQLHCSKAKELKEESVNNQNILTNEMDSQMAGKTGKDVSKCREEREHRIRLFLKHIDDKRIRMLENLSVES